MSLPIANLVEKLEIWKARLALAKKDRKKMLDQGEKNVRRYEGHILDAIGYKESVSVNLVYVDMKQTVPELYSKNPYIYFSPEEPSAEAECDIFELAVNNKWNDMGMKEKGRELVKSTKLFGVCAFKTYYVLNDPDAVNEDEDPFAEKKNDDIFTERVPLKNLLKSPDHTWKDSPWIAHEVCEKVDTIAKKFNIKDRKDITVESSTKNSGSQKWDAYVMSDFQYGTYYEIEDRENGEIIVIVEGLNKFAKNPKKKTYPYRTMYDFLTYNDIPDRPNVLSDYYFWQDQLLEVAKFRTMFMNHARKGSSKYKITTANPLTEKQRTQLRSSEESSFVELSPDQDIQPMLSAPVDPSIIQAEAVARADIQLISKSSPVQMVGQDKTATEVKAVEFARKEITSESLERLEEVLASVAQKHVLLMQKEYQASRLVKLTDMPEALFLNMKDKHKDLLQGDAKHPFLKLNGSMLKKKVRAKVRAGSTTPDTQESRISKLRAFTQFVSASPTLAGQVDTQELVKEAVEAFGLENDNLLIKKDNPAEENALLNRGVYLAPKITEDHEKHLEVHKKDPNMTAEKQLHMLGHELFKKQIEQNKQGEIKSSQLKALEQPITGGSFNGMQNPIQGQMPQQGALPNGSVGPANQPGPLPAQ